MLIICFYLKYLNICCVMCLSQNAEEESHVECVSVSRRWWFSILIKVPHTVHLCMIISQTHAMTLKM